MTATVTIAMPARNVAPYIGAALDSVLQPGDVSLEVVVIDDASDDNTFAVATRHADARVRVLRNEVRRGIGWCHNRILHEARTPFLMHVDADDVVLPGAIPRMVAALAAAPRAAQAYCDFYTTPPDGQTDDVGIARWREAFALARRAPIAVRRQLLVHGMVVNHLRTYRREALLEVGGFDEKLPWAVDYEVALRLAERWEFVHVPAMLYAKRVLPIGASEAVRWKSWRFFAMRWRLVRRLLRTHNGRLFGYSSLAVHALLLAGLADTLGSDAAAVTKRLLRSEQAWPRR